MPGIAIQFRRGTTTNHSNFAGLLGEVTFDTTKKTLVLHDGSTLGGTPLAKEVHTHVASSVSGLSYQTIQIAGSAQTQQPTLNLSSLFAASNDIANSRTTVDLASNNTSGAGTYGAATRVARITVNSQGLITSIAEVTISGVAPAGTATGDLSGNYPGPTVASVGGATAANIGAAVTTVLAAASGNTPSTLVERDSSGNFAANVITASLNGNITGNAGGTAVAITGNLTGDVTSIGMVTTLSTSGVSAGQYGSATQVPKINVDAKGRITSVTLVSITGTSPGGGAGGDLAGNYPNPTVNMVNGVTATNIAAGATAANNSVAAATPSTIVKRDGGGSAAFTTVTQSINVVGTSSTPSFNLGAGAIQQMTINAATTISLSGLSAGWIGVFDFIHDGTTTQYGLTWPTNVFGGASTVGGAASKHNSQLFWCDGTNLYALGTMRVDQG